jgi:hypothetical protein
MPLFCFICGHGIRAEDGARFGFLFAFGKMLLSP